MVITVKEPYRPSAGTPHFFAQADKQTNQKATLYAPSGWG